MTNCLKKLFSHLKKFLKTFSKAEASESIEDGDILSRFIFSSDQFKNGVAKYSAFMPRPAETSISTYKTTGLSKVEIVDLEHKFVSSHRTDGKRAKAWAENTAKNIHSHGLSVVALKIPHPRHFDLAGFPNDKGKAKLIATKLAISARVITT